MEENVKPRKRHWGRRILLVFFVLVVAILVVPPILTNREERQLKERIERYRAAGEPVDAAGLATTPLTDEENAVVELREAAAQINSYAGVNEAWKKLQQTDFGYPLTAKEKPLMHAVAADNGPVIALVDTAMTKDGFYWPSQPTSPLITWMLPDLSRMRELTRFLQLTALNDRSNGDDAAVANDLRRLLFCARAMDHHPQALVVHLVAEAMRGSACSLTLTLAPHLNVGTGPRQASPQALKAIIAELSDDAFPSDSFQRGMLAERVMALDMADALINNRLPPSALAGVGGSGLGVLFSPAARHLTGPWLLGDTVVIVDNETKMLDAARLPDWPSSHEQLAHLYDAIDLSPIRHFWARMMMPRLDRAIEGGYRGGVHRHLAATVLAARWYAAEHDGHFPPSMDALVPNYLPAVPRDPYAAGLPPLHYLPAEPDPRVYSVGSNGVDDKGSEEPTRRGSRHSVWDCLDVVVHLHPQPRDTADLDYQLKD